MAAIRSPLVTRPSLPEPETDAGSTPLSAASLETAGPLASAVTGFAGAAAGAGFEGSADLAGSAALAGSAGLAAGFAAAAPPSAIEPSSAPTPTVSPSLASCASSTPAAGAGTSIVTLSVSSSTSGSSAATLSPTFLNQRPIVASVADSPRVGTRISVAMTRSLPFGSSLMGVLEGRRCAALRQAKASSRKDASWARCFDIRPVAVAAEAGRPT